MFDQTHATATNAVRLLIAASQLAAIVLGLGVPIAIAIAIRLNGGVR